MAGNQETWSDEYQTRDHTDAIVKIYANLLMIFYDDAIAKICVNLFMKIF